MIAQAVDKWEYATWILVTCLLLLVAGIVLYLGVWYCRRWWRDLPASSSQPWTLEDLRQLRERGDLTEEEYQAMRRAMLDVYRGSEPALEETHGGPDNAESSDKDPDFDLKKSPQA